MKYIIAIATGVALVIVFLNWTTQRDEKVRISAERYEQCVKQEYGGRTPSEVREETGEYPVCDFNNIEEK